MEPPAMNAVYPAPAKLNLFLHVVGRRPDGYHLLQTLFRFIDFGDELRFEVREDGLIRRAVDLPDVPAEGDLCLRAAALLQQETGCRLGVTLHLDKRLPMGGGLGGGSSDAATVLLVLNRLWKLDLDRETLQSLGLRLGADVPVFVFGESAFAEGVGEKLRAFALPPAWYVVLRPPVQVPTREIFAAPELTRDTKAIKITGLLEGWSTGWGRNDLEPVACARYPVIGEYLRWLGRFGPARMTGSGACVFAEFSSESKARDVVRQMPAGMRGFAARGLDRHPLYDLVGNAA
jgi:4-diphosphocytidyl-2-C-methyl-D-erythritol kinase